MYSIHSIVVNLQHGDSIWPHPTIAFHLNPRFANIGGKHMIVKNSWLDGKWDREERSEIHTDFMPSRSFHMLIECGDVSYNVFLNGKFIAEFRFRIKPDIVDTLYIQGDITLKHVSQTVKPLTDWMSASKRLTWRLTFLPNPYVISIKFKIVCSNFRH